MDPGFRWEDGRTSATQRYASPLPNRHVLRRPAIQINPHHLMQIRIRDPQHTGREREPARLVKSIIDAQRPHLTALLVEHLDAVVVAVGDEHDAARIRREAERILQTSIGATAAAVSEFVEAGADRGLDARL